MNIERPSDLSEETSPPSEKPSADSLTSGARILIAEDDPVSCEVLATRLKKWGYDTVITRDGHEAMAAMRSADAPSLAILDWMMPGMDGIEVCRRLREVNKAVYVIMLTSLGTKGMGEGGGAGIHAVCAAIQDALRGRGKPIVYDSCNPYWRVWEMLQAPEATRELVEVRKV